VATPPSAAAFVASDGPRRGRGLQTEERIKAKRAAASIPIPVDAVVTELLQLAQGQSAIELETTNSTNSESLETAKESSEDSAEEVEDGKVFVAPNHQHA
jgi:hypothetical protein